MSPVPDQVYEFGRFRLNVAQRELLRDGTSLAVMPKVFDLLVLLVRSPGRLLTKEEILERVWPDACVDEGSLARTVSRLRSLLGEGGRTGGFVETLSKQGYRFVADVRSFAPPVVRDRTLAVLPTTGRTDAMPNATLRFPVKHPMRPVPRGTGHAPSISPCASLLTANCGAALSRTPMRMPALSRETAKAGTPERGPARGTLRLSHLRRFVTTSSTATSSVPTWKTLRWKTSGSKTLVIGLHHVALSLHRDRRGADGGMELRLSATPEFCQPRSSR